jgi:hypothetical protein
MKTIIYPVVVMLSLLLTSCSNIASKEKPSTSNGIPRDTFLLLLSSAFNDKCDEPKSPFACIVTSLEVCRKNLPLAVEQCINGIRSQLPEVIESSYDDSREKEQFSTCLLNKFTSLAGAKNLNVNQCE